MKNIIHTQLYKISEINSDSYSDSFSWAYVNYLDTSNITENVIDNVQYIDLSKEKLPSRAKRLVKNHSIIYSTVRPNQKHYGIIQDCPSNFLVSTGFAVINVNPSLADPNFVYFFLTKNDIVTRLQSLAQQSTSAYPSIKTSDLENLEINLPPLKDQKKIGSFLSSVNSAIQINRLEISELESLAKTIYDYWFLQFDFPNEEGKPYKSSGGAMVWNNKLNMEIPISWNVESITSVADVYQPKTISISDLNDSLDYPVYGAGGYMGRYSQYNHENSELVVSCRGVCGEIFQTMPNSWITGNAMVVHANGQDVTINYLYEFLKAFGVSKYVTGSVQKQLTRENLSHMPVLCPQTDILNKYEEIAQRIRSMIENNIRENEELTKLRDFLLPLLMNGQVGFKD